MSAVIHHGDCLEILRGMADASVDAVVTDPPYGLSFMGKKWDYDVPSADIWRECLRVLKPGGHLLAFAGTRTQHRMAVNIEDAGFEIRDMIAWVYGSGFPKSHNLQDAWQGWGTALKPAMEPITVARKPFKGTVAENVLRWGTGGMNVDGCRVGTEGGTTRSHQAAYAKSGWRTGHSIETLQAGRWPANLIHDGSDEVFQLFPDTGKSTEGRIGKKTMSTVTNVPAGHYEAGDPGYGDSGSAARFFYCAKASKADRDEGLERFEKRQANQIASKDGGGGGWAKDADKNPNLPRANNHPTVKPTVLMRYLCRLVTPPKGIVLDPFMGSGSTGKAAILEGFQFIGIEREAEYVEIAEARIANADTKPSA